MTQTSEISDRADVLIIGGGPAGLAAFRWCAELGMSVVMIEKANEFGGQLTRIHNPITNYPGCRTLNGTEMRDRFVSGIKLSGKNCHLDSMVANFDGADVNATLKNGSTITARTAIIATGVRQRKLGVPGEDEFKNRGVLESGVKQSTSVVGKRVAVIGGGDAAIENALIFSEHAEKVFLIHRRNEFGARTEFVSKAEQEPKINFKMQSTVTAILGDKSVKSIELSTIDGSRSERIPVDAVLVRIGVEPNSELFGHQLDLDDRGYILVDHRGQTSLRNIFAAGDVANPVAPTISTAAGTAATTVKAIYSLIYGKLQL